MAREDVVNWTISLNSFQNKELIRYVEREVRRTKRSRSSVIRNLIKDAVYFRDRDIR